MLSVQAWWRIIETYGTHIWPAQLMMWAGAVMLSVYWLLKPGAISIVLMKLYLVLSFAWIGVGFFIVLGKGLAGNYFFGVLFTFVALLFAIDLYRRRMHFGLPEKTWQKSLTLALLGLVLCYPLIGMIFGHFYPRLIAPGTFPCPTTAFALVLLTTALPYVDRIMYGILLFWAIPFPVFIQIPKYGVYEDGIMLLVGLYSAIMLAVNWKQPDKRKS